MKIYIVGTGMDGVKTLTNEAAAAIEDAEVLIGAERMLEPFRDLGKKLFADLGIICLTYHKRIHYGHCKAGFLDGLEISDTCIGSLLLVMDKGEMFEFGESYDSVLKCKDLLITDLYFSENLGFDKHMVSFPLQIIKQSILHYLACSHQSGLISNTCAFKSDSDFGDINIFVLALKSLECGLLVLKPGLDESEL